MEDQIFPTNSRQPQSPLLKIHWDSIVHYALCNLYLCWHNPQQNETVPYCYDLYSHLHHPPAKCLGLTLRYVCSTACHSPQICMTLMDYAWLFIVCPKFHRFQHQYLQLTFFLIVWYLNDMSRRTLLSDVQKNNPASST